MPDICGKFCSAKLLKSISGVRHKCVSVTKTTKNLNEIPTSMDVKGLKSAYQEADRHKWTKEELEEYEYSRMRETDEIAEKLLVEEKKAMAIAKKLIKRKLSNEEIAEDTGLDLEMIEALRNEMEQN